jgi:hypothetical protein
VEVATHVLDALISAPIDAGRAHHRDGARGVRQPQREATIRAAQPAAEVRLIDEPVATAYASLGGTLRARVHHDLMARSIVQSRTAGRALPS